ncbi:MAG: O-antigen ligase family protein [Candidatus Polarisedimenticolia bacterium]
MTLLSALLLAVLPWFEGGASPLGLFLAHTLVLAMLAIAVGRVALRGEVRLAAGWEAAAGLAFVAVCFISFLGVDYRFGSFLALWNVLAAALLGCALLIEAPRRPERLAQVVAASAAVQALLAWIMRPVPNMTPSARFANANQLAAYLVIGALLSAGLFLTFRRRGRTPEGRSVIDTPWIWGGLALVDLSALLRLGARGALLALMAAGVAWGLTSGAHRRPAVRWAFWGGLLAVLILSAAAVTWRFHRIQDPYRFDRVRIWSAGLQAAADHPLLGMGPGMFERRGYVYNFPLENQMFHYAKTPGSVHSTWLQALVETGVIGLAAALIFVLLLARRALRAAEAGQDDLARGAALALLACLLQGIVDTPFDVPAITLTLMVLIIPLVTPATAREAPLLAQWAWNPSSPRARAATAAALAGVAVVHAAAVGFPWAAHHSFERAVAGKGDAQAGLARAIRLEPWNPLYPATRGELAARRGGRLDPATLAQAHLDLLRAHRIDPGNPDHLLALAQLHKRACFDLGCDPAGTARAERAYLDAISLGRKDPRPLVELASLRVSLGRPVEAIPLLEKAVSLEPRFLEAWLGLARARLESGRTQAAADALQGLERARYELRGYHPKNGYERDLMRIDRERVAQVMRRITQVMRGIQPVDASP